ncbi:hypothetical protein [uncultured Thiohalocapsa sp.]|uniref:hypothetical protein n=1 Tax=uncultured Thiohalocapsa sp. TaxID=768990 RepID=UPI0025F4A5EB|nr:hypothetical protein [uncultured Thiohalocapsa sp.]
MTRFEYRITFSSPAFLGNAEQNGQWRTPPFKALLRQWWRIVHASERGGSPPVDQLREEEGALFGVASDQRNGSRKSGVRLRLQHWNMGQQETWPPLARVQHPEVNFPVDSGLYLGFGPVLLPKGAKQPALKKNAALQAGESATLSIACPDDAVPSLQTAFYLIDRYGTIGGRSRNGWGSFQLSLPDETAPLAKPRLATSLLRPWRACLGQDWPHAIGSDDEGPLIWQTTQSFNDWRGVMQQLAALKIGLRTQFPFKTGNGAHLPEKRHWLSYPVTRHSVKSWGNARLPNSLRFKVRAEPNGDGFRGLIVHLPCLPPAQPFRPDRRAIEAVWAQVHAYLDQAQALTRAPH